MSDLSNEYLPGAEEAEPEPQEPMLPTVMVAPITPLASRDAGLSAYLASALSRAGTLRLTPDESTILKMPFGDECFVTGAGGKDELIYVEAPYLRERMDAALGIGQWSFVQLRSWTEEYKTGKGFRAVRIYSEGSLIVRGVYVTQAVGDMSYYPDNPQTNYGDAYEGAQSHCLRRCLKWFGLGLQAWSKTFQKGWFERKLANGKAPPTPPAAPAPKATPKAQSAKPTIATTESRARMIEKLDAGDDGANRSQFTAYLRALKWIPEDKEPENLALCYVPTSLGDFERLQAGLGQFTLTGAATLPYQPHGLDATKLPTPAAKTPPAGNQTPLQPVWASFVMPLGKPHIKGKKMGEIDKEELFPFWADFQPQEQVELPDGTIVPLSAEQVKAQKDLRAMLDLAGRDLDFKQPKEAA